MLLRAALGGHGVLRLLAAHGRAPPPGPHCRSEERVSVEGLHDLATPSLCTTQLGAWEAPVCVCVSYPFYN